MILLLESCWTRKLVHPSRETAEARSATSPVSRPDGYLRRHVFSTRFEPVKVIVKASECCMTDVQHDLKRVVVFYERGDKEYRLRRIIKESCKLSLSGLVAHTHASSLCADQLRYCKRMLSGTLHHNAQVPATKILHPH